MKAVAAALAVFTATAAVAQTEPPVTFDDVVARAAEQNEARHRAAADALNAARARVAAEKAPLLEALRRAEDRLIAAESEARRIATSTEATAAERRRLLRDLDAVRKFNSFAATLAHDGLTARLDSLAPGEQGLAGSIQELLTPLQDSETPAEAGRALDAVAWMLERTEHDLGGELIDGAAVDASTNALVRGTFARIGPETFFRAADGTTAGAVRGREGSPHPVYYPMPAWPAADAAALFSGGSGTILADASGGKALRLQETTGTALNHIKKGGPVAFVIVAVGLAAAAMILQKLRDVARFRVDGAELIEGVLGSVARGSQADAERAVAALKGPVRELFAAGLKYRHEPKAILEEHLESVLLEQRLTLERRLPLLAVIATAAPLMGLFGTVVGMVKTFALITVFGTGDAGRLSSGISEVLVATELGLAVAIPTLIAHGFLAHRIEKNLAQLERSALRFVIAAETSRAARPDGAPANLTLA